LFAQIHLPFCYFYLFLVSGYTPLHLAAQGNYADICKILKTAGADVNAQLKDNKKTPMDLTTSEYINNYLLGTALPMQRFFVFFFDIFD